MGGFGQFLVEKGVLTGEQLEEALRFQQVYGGRMGTVVVDLGYLVVEELAEHLSDSTGVPLPPPDWVEAPDEQALAQVPPPMVRRCQALPMRVDRSRLHVAMLDPTDPEKLDFLAMASSRDVVPYVLPERRLLYWLEVHCGIDRPPRFLGMMTRPRPIGLTKEEAESGTPMLDTRERIEHVAAKAQGIEARLPEEEADSSFRPLSLGTPIDALSDSSDEDTGATAAEREAGGGVGRRGEAEAEEGEEEEILLLDELVAESPANEAWELEDEDLAPESTPASGVAPVEALSVRLARLETKLYQSRNRDEVIALALEIASAFCVSAALFVVRGDSISLFRASDVDAHGGGDDLAIPILTPSLFTQPAQTGQPFRGPPPLGGVDGRVLDGLGRDAVQEILVHPIVLRDRVVNLLYADNGPEVFGETSIGALTALGHTLASAYGRLIADQKRQRQG